MRVTMALLYESSRVLHAAIEAQQMSLEFCLFFVFRRLVCAPLVGLVCNGDEFPAALKTAPSTAGTKSMFSFHTG